MIMPSRIKATVSYHKKHKDDCGKSRSNSRSRSRSNSCDNRTKKWGC
jgi:hypothetical protein